MTRRTFLRLAVSSGAGLIVSYSFFIERYIVQVNEYRVPVPNLPEEFSGFRIVHLTDLHYGFLVPMKLMKWVVHKSNGLRKDLTVCTGDYVLQGSDTKQVDEIWPVLSGLEARKGVFSVQGNHDYWADAEKSLYWAEKAGQNLRGKVRAFERNGKRIWFAGGGDFAHDHLDFDNLLSGIPEKDCRIVLVHNPDSADSEYTVRTDLIIAGHTHGGQVRLPFLGAPILPVRNKNYSHGIRKSEKNTTVFISKGIGWSICPVRFNCYPEIAVLELVPERI